MIIYYKQTIRAHLQIPCSKLFGFWNVLMLINDTSVVYSRIYNNLTELLEYHTQRNSKSPNVDPWASPQFMIPASENNCLMKQKSLAYRMNSFCFIWKTCCPVISYWDCSMTVKFPWSISLRGQVDVQTEQSCECKNWIITFILGIKCCLLALSVLTIYPNLVRTKVEMISFPNYLLYILFER